MFYNEKQHFNVEKYEKRNSILNEQIIKNKLIQDRLDDLIASAQSPIAPLERQTINRANELLKDLKQRHYKLWLAQEINFSIMLHKQGKYELALKKIQRAEKDPHENQILKPAQRKYFPLTNEIKCLHKNSPFVNNIFVNIYNIKGMIIRSLYQANNEDSKKYPLTFAEENFKKAIIYPKIYEENMKDDSYFNDIAFNLNNEHAEKNVAAYPVILSNLAFLKNKMGQHEKALILHEKAYQSKNNDENDVAIINGFAYGISQTDDVAKYEIALGLFERALTLKPNELDILQNKAFLLIKISDKIEKNGSTLFSNPKEYYLSQAKSCLNEALKDNKHEMVDTLMLHAELSYRLRECEEALKFLDKRDVNKLVYSDQVNWHTNKESSELRSKIEKSLGTEQCLKRKPRCKIN